MQRTAFIFLGFAAALVTGCFEPTINQGLSCASTGMCPTGQLCDPVSMECRLERTVLDAAPQTSDAAAIDGPAQLPFCSAADLALCLEFDGTITNGSAALVDIDVEGAPTYVAGHRGMALEGSADTTIEARDVFALEPQAVTYEMWLSVSATVDSFILDEDNFVLAVRNGDLSLMSTTDGSFLRIAPFPTGRFFHLAYRIRDNNAEVLIDGISREITTVIYTPANPVSIEIANDDEVGGLVLAGAIDDLRVWPRLLSDQEIADAAARRPRHERSVSQGL